MMDAHHAVNGGNPGAIMAGARDKRPSVRCFWLHAGSVLPGSRLCTIAGVLPLRGGRRPARSLTRRARPAAAAGLRVARHRAGPQRAGRAAGCRRAGLTGRARADLTAGPERAAGIRGSRRQHRNAGPGARSQDTGHHPEGRQDRHHPAGAPHRAGDRPGRWRARGIRPSRGRLRLAGPQRPSGAQARVPGDRRPN